MKKFILSLTLILTVAFGAVITVARPAPLSARAETSVTIEERVSSITLQELLNTSNFKKIEVGDDLSNKTIYRTKNDSDFVLHSNFYGMFFSTFQSFWGKLAVENEFDSMQSLDSFSTYEELDLVGTLASDFDDLDECWAQYPVIEYKITGNFGEVTNLDLSSGDLYIAAEFELLASQDIETVYTSNDLSNRDMFKLIEVGDVIKKNDVFAIYNNGTPIVCVTSEKYFIVAHYQFNNATVYIGEFNVPGTRIDGANLMNFLISFRVNTTNVVEYSFCCVASTTLPNGTFKILCDFGEVTNVYAGASEEYISTFSVEEPEDESTSESAIEDDSQKFIDKTTAWINDNLGLSLTSSFVGAVLLVLIISFFVNRAKK